MTCKNCHKDIGQRNACPYCGFDPILDAPNAAGRKALSAVQPQSIRINLLEIPNKKATAAMVLSFFGWFPVTGLLSLIFGLQAFFRAKACRNGRGKAIAALVIMTIWGLVYIYAIRQIAM